MAMNRYQPGVFNNFGGNRGLGFNRATWNTGNAIGRAARPYIDRSLSTIRNIGSRIASRISSQRSARGAQQQNRRNLRSRRAAAPIGRQIPSSGGESKSFTTVSNPKLKYGLTKQMLGVNTINRNVAGTISSASGSQGIQAVGEYFNVTDIQNAFIAVGQNNVYDNSGKIAFQSLHSTHLYTNSCSINVHMTIYDVMARYDGSDTNTSPVLVIQAGGADAGGGLTTDWSIPGTSPFNNPRFTSSYKIIKQTPVVLGPGQTHNHIVKYSLNRVLSKERIVTSDLAGPLGGVTVYTFVILHGTPAHESAAETTVSLSLAKVDYVVMESFTYRSMLLNRASNSITNSLPVLASGEQWSEETPADVPNAS